MNHDEIQLLMDVSAGIGNIVYNTPYNNQVHDLLSKLDAIIKAHRGHFPPDCWGHDDCCSSQLSVCSWRHDCGNEESIKWIDWRQRHE